MDALRESDASISYDDMVTTLPDGRPLVDNTGRQIKRKVSCAEKRPLAATVTEKSSLPWSILPTASTKLRLLSLPQD